MADVNFPMSPLVDFVVLLPDVYRRGWPQQHVQLAGTLLLVGPLVVGGGPADQQAAEALRRRGVGPRGTAPVASCTTSSSSSSYGWKWPYCLTYTMAMRITCRRRPAHDGHEGVSWWGGGGVAGQRGLLHHSHVIVDAAVMGRV